MGFAVAQKPSAQPVQCPFMAKLVGVSAGEGKEVRGRKIQGPVTISSAAGNEIDLAFRFKENAAPEGVGVADKAAAPSEGKDKMAPAGDGIEDIQNGKPALVGIAAEGSGAEARLRGFGQAQVAGAGVGPAVHGGAKLVFVLGLAENLACGGKACGSAGESIFLAAQGQNFHGKLLKERTRLGKAPGAVRRSGEGGFGPLAGMG